MLKKFPFHFFSVTRCIDCNPQRAHLRRTCRRTLAAPHQLPTACARCMRPTFALLFALPAALSLRPALRPPLAAGYVRHARSATPVALFSAKPPAPKKAVAGKAGARGVVKPTAVKKSVTKPVKKSVKKSATAVKRTPAKKAPAKTVRKPATAKPARPVAKTAAKGVTGSKDKKLQAYLVEQKRSLKKKKAEAQDRENRQIVAARKARVETIARNKENARLAKQRCSRATSLSSPRPLGQPHNALPPPQRIAPSSRISAAPCSSALRYKESLEFLKAKEKKAKPVAASLRLISKKEQARRERSGKFF